MHMYVCCLKLPGKGAATAKPLIFYVSAQDILSSVQQHGEGHAGDVAFLWCADFITEGELEQCLETHLRELLSHPDINLCFYSQHNMKGLKLLRI